MANPPSSNAPSLPALQGMVLSEVFPPQNGGSGKWLWEIYRRQPAQRYLMAVGNSHGSDSRDLDYPQSIERIDLVMPFRGMSKLSSLRHYWRQARMIRRLVRQHKIGRIHAARPLSEGLVARFVKLTTGVPYICYVHGEDVNIAMTSRELQILTRSVLNQSTRVIANSSFTKKLLLEDWLIPNEKIALMHPGVDTEFFQPTTADSTCPAHWKGKNVLLTVGRLQKRKGHDTVIQAIAELRGSIPDIHYVIVGGGEERQSLEQLAETQGVADQVEFVGEINDLTLRNYYQHCTLFVLANRTIGRDIEGFGIVLLEAQACGKPVIAGDSGGTSDTMQKGESGLIVPCDTPEKLVNSLRLLLNDPEKRQAMGESGRRFVRENFHWDQLGNQAQKVFAM